MREGEGEEEDGYTPSAYLYEQNKEVHFQIQLAMTPRASDVEEGEGKGKEEQDGSGNGRGGKERKGKKRFVVQLCSCPVCLFVGEEEWARARDGFQETLDVSAGEGSSSSRRVEKQKPKRKEREQERDDEVLDGDGEGDWDGEWDGDGGEWEDGDWDGDELFSPTMEAAFGAAEGYYSGKGGGLGKKGGRSKKGGRGGGGLRNKKSKSKLKAGERWDPHLGRVVHVKKTKIKASVYAKAVARSEEVASQLERKKINTRTRLAKVLVASGLASSFQAAMAALEAPPPGAWPNGPPQAYLGIQQARPRSHFCGHDHSHGRSERRARTRDLRAVEEAEMEAAYTASLLDELDVDPRLAQLLVELQTRDATPEDYELLLLLDESVEPATLDEAQVEVMATMTVGEDFEAEEGDVCPICLFEYEEGDVVRQLPCSGNHVYHMACIDQYFMSFGNTCPVDRSELA